MEKSDLELIKSLMEENGELRVLMEEHGELEEQLVVIRHKRYLTAEDEVEKKTLQKLKLAGRDKIEEILSEHR